MLQRLGEIVGAMAQFVEQPRILDGDDGLISEYLQQLLVLFRSGAGLGPTSDDRT